MFGFSKAKTNQVTSSKHLSNAANNAGHALEDAVCAVAGGVATYVAGACTFAVINVIAHSPLLWYFNVLSATGIGTVAAQSGVYTLEKAGSAISNFASSIYELGAAAVTAVSEIGDAILGSGEEDASQDIDTPAHVGLKDLIHHDEPLSSSYVQIDDSLDLIGFDSYSASAA